VGSFIAGEVPGSSPYSLTDTQLTRAASLVRDFHDATTASNFTGDHEVVDYGDLGPYNTVFGDGEPVGIASNCAETPRCSLTRCPTERSQDLVATLVG
jgi:hypothetical protein